MCPLLCIQIEYIKGDTRFKTFCRISFRNAEARLERFDSYKQEMYIKNGFNFQFWVF